MGYPIEFQFYGIQLATSSNLNIDPGGLELHKGHEITHPVPSREILYGQGFLLLGVANVLTDICLEFFFSLHNFQYDIM